MATVKHCCRHCDHVLPPATWRTFRGGTRHLEVVCPECGKVNFLPQTPQNVAAAKPEEEKPTTANTPSLF